MCEVAKSKDCKLRRTRAFTKKDKYFGTEGVDRAENMKLPLLDSESTITEGCFGSLSLYPDDV